MSAESVSQAGAPSTTSQHPFHPSRQMNQQQRQQPRPRNGRSAKSSTRSAAVSSSSSSSSGTSTPTNGRATSATSNGNSRSQPRPRTQQHPRPHQSGFNHSNTGAANFYNNIRSFYQASHGLPGPVRPTGGLLPPNPPSTVTGGGRHMGPMPTRPPNGMPGYRQGPPLRHNVPMADSSHAGLLKATNLPVGTTQRIFRKKVGYAVAAAFPDPPRFKAFVKSFKGKPEYGTVIFPNEDCCNRFLRNYGYRSGKSVEINKTSIQFRKEDPLTANITQQEAACLRTRSKNIQVDNSDYEDEDDDPVDVYLQHVSAGAWDAEGQYAPAWFSNETFDRCSKITIDGDAARLIIRIEEQLISIGLYQIQSIVVSDKDVYITSSVLPTFLDDESQGYAELKETVGMMDFGGLTIDTTFIRTPALDADHAKVAQFCYVYKVRCTSRLELDKFFSQWQKKLIEVVEYMPIAQNRDTPFANHNLINIRKWFRTLPFELAFQAQSFVSEGYIMPNELVQLQPSIASIARALPPVKAARLFQLVTKTASHRVPGERAHSDVISLIAEINHNLAISQSGALGRLESDSSSGFFDIHSATITPASVILEGPHRDSGNRIIRQYPGKESYFMRVRLQDETGDLIKEGRGINNDRKIFSERMKRFLLEGIELGGRLFRFLAFSTSSLKEHSTWFVADFVHEGKEVSAQSIRDGIGDLSEIRIPARYAARMGQAFTSTTFSLDIESAKILTIPDVKRNSFIFSDGCGVISYDTLKRLHETDFRRRRNRRKNALPTVFQVRIAGAKGVVSLDTNFTKGAVGLRESMIKFQLPERSGSLPLEIANSSDTALGTNLNRPLVALLETLGVPPSHFVEIQDRAVKDLSQAATDTVAALKMYRAAGFGTAPDCSDLLQTLHRVLGIQGIIDVPFLKRCNLTCLQSSLRQIKYKARCKVEEAWTLMGIMDETGWLQPGQIYVQLRDNRTSQVTYLSGSCIVGRSPYLAPGDVQYATLVGAPPAGSTLHNIYNCVVFSQLGTRPLSNKLAGGDLDGDLYNVIKNPLLFPQILAQPAIYPAMNSKQLPRPCTVEDVVDFFLTYCQTDRLGMIADRHLLISDRSTKGVQDESCLVLAKLASVAVDYQKTGVPPELNKIPRLPDNARPDYTQSEYRVESQHSSRRAQWSRESRTYYESKKALGQMFRKIDVDSDIGSWGRAAPDPLSEKEIRDKYWAKIRPWLKDDWIDHVTDVMTHVQTFYGKLVVYASDYAPERRRDPLSEPELFMGCILGRFSSRFGSGSRGYNAQTALREDISELIDQTMTDHCGSENWYTTIISAAGLTDLEQKGEDIQVVKKEAEQILTELARWIRAAEMLEDSGYAGSEGVMSEPSKKKKKGDHYETAKWIAIGPALKKVEELNVFMAFWTARIEARLARLRASEGTDDGRNSAGQVRSSMTYITNAPM